MTGKGKHKNLLKPKLKPTLHNAFAILSQPDDPTNYKMSGPPLKMDEDKTISGGNNGVVRRGRCGAQSAVLGPEGREMKFSKKY